MKKDLFIHGTSLKAAKKIINEGFDASKGKQVWNVSGGRNYFLSVRKTFRKRYSAKWDAEVSLKKTFDETIQVGFEQATSNAALDGSSRRVVFLVDLIGLDYRRDSSCSYTNAVETVCVVAPERILKIWVDEWDVSCMLPIWRKRLEYHPMTNVKIPDNPWERLVSESLGAKSHSLDLEKQWKTVTAKTLKRA